MSCSTRLFNTFLNVYIIGNNSRDFEDLLAPQHPRCHLEEQDRQTGRLFKSFEFFRAHLRIISLIAKHLKNITN
jgi:hypothetical protein